MPSVAPCIGGFGRFLADIHADLTAQFTSTCDPENTVRMVGLLFARPAMKLVKDEILPNLQYFHHRSGPHISVYCCGFQLLESPSDLQRLDVIKIDDKVFVFKDRTFVRLVQEFEEISRWHYSGGTDLILTNARYSRVSGAYLDLSGSIRVNLDKLQAQKGAEPLAMFFEKIFRYAEKQNGTDPTWGFSDEQGKRLAVSAFKGLVASAIPETIRDNVKEAFQFVVEDISPD